MRCETHTFSALNAELGLVWWQLCLHNSFKLLFRFARSRLLVCCSTQGRRISEAVGKCVYCAGRIAVQLAFKWENSAKFCTLFRKWFCYKEYNDPTKSKHKNDHQNSLKLPTYHKHRWWRTLRIVDGNYQMHICVSIWLCS